MTVEVETDAGTKKTQNGVVVDGGTQKPRKAGRKPAPKIRVPDRMIDYRSRKLKELNDRKDGYEYSYIRTDVTDQDLEFMEAELVRYREGPKKGQKMHFKGDPVIRRKKELLDAERKADAEFSERQLKEVVKTRETTVYRNEKKPKE